MTARGVRWATAALAALAGGGVSLAGGAAAAASGGVPFTASETVGTLHRVNQMEIEAGKIAQRLGASEAVRKYGATLEHDHAEADERLKRYATQHRVDLDTAPPVGVGSALAQARTELQNLTRLGGASFDLAFAELMRRDHQTIITAVDRARVEIVDPQLKALLGQLEPELREHEQMAAGLLSDAHTRARAVD